MSGLRDGVASRPKRPRREFRFGLAGFHFEEMRERKLRTDEDGFFPGFLMNPYVLLIIFILAVVLVVSGVLFAVFATSTLLTLVFVGVGLYLLVKPEILASMGSVGRWGIPLGLVAFGAVIHLGWLRF